MTLLGQKIGDNDTSVFRKIKLSLLYVIRHFRPENVIYVPNSFVFKKKIKILLKKTVLS